MQQTPEVLAKIANWKAKQEAGTMTAQDWKDAMSDLRAARAGAQAASAAARAKRAPVDVEALKASLRGFSKKA
jgi:hypothetical protein